MNSPDKILPYLDTAYWDGYSFDTAPDIYNPTPITSDRCSKRLAKEALRERLTGGRSIFPIVSYGDGDVFDAEASSLGTITLFRKEGLYKPHTVEDISFDNSPASILVPRDTSPDILPDEHGDNTIVVNGYGYSYSSRVYWGIVCRNKKRTRTFEAWDTQFIFRKPQGLYMMFEPEGHAKQFQIGAVRHEADTKRQALKRITALRVVATGNAVRKRRRIHDIAQTFAKSILQPVQP